MKRLIEQTADYRSEVKVKLWDTEYSDARPDENKYMEGDDKAVIEYNIDLEFRSYGIHGITFNFRSLRINIWEVDWERDDMSPQNEREIEVDLSEATIEWVAGDGFYPVEIEVRVDKDGKPIPEKTEITCAYLKPDRD